MTTFHNKIIICIDFTHYKTRFQKTEEPMSVIKQNDKSEMKLQVD